MTTSMNSSTQFSSAPASTGSLQSAVMNVNEFYNNSTLPVLIPFHYCCTPLLFHPNWYEKVVSESMLRNKSANYICRALRVNNTGK